MVTIQLNDTLAANLGARAAAQGLTIEAFLESLFISKLPLQKPMISVEELDRLLDELALDGPSPTGTFSRAELYSDHD